jgi:hypothetical protein
MKANRFSDVVLDIKTGKVLKRFNVTKNYKGPVERAGGFSQAIEAQVGNTAGALATTQTLQGAIPIQQHFTLGSAGAITVTLPTPLAGSQQNGGDDGKILMFSTLTAQAHVVTTAANKIQTNKVTATSSAAIGNFLILIANGGFWWAVSNLNFTLA